MEQRLSRCGICQTSLGSVHIHFWCFSVLYTLWTPSVLLVDLFLFRQTDFVFCCLQPRNLVCTMLAYVSPYNSIKKVIRKHDTHLTDEKNWGLKRPILWLSLVSGGARTRTHVILVQGLSRALTLLFTWTARIGKQKQLLNLPGWWCCRKQKTYGYSSVSSAGSLFKQSVSLPITLMKEECNNLSCWRGGNWILKKWPLNFFPEWLWDESERRGMLHSFQTLSPFFQ